MLNLHQNMLQNQKNQKKKNLANYYLAPLYIDIGVVKEDAPMVLRGIELIDKNFDVWSKFGSPEKYAI